MSPKEFNILSLYVTHESRMLGPYSLIWIKLSKKSGQYQIRIKENGSADLWFIVCFTEELLNI